jgi:hypothetical protein
MTVEQGLVYALRADGAVAALIEDRIEPYPGTADLPRITYLLVDAPLRRSLDRARTGGKIRVQLNLHAATYADVKQLQDAVFAALNGRTTPLGDFPSHACFVEDHADEPGPVVPGQPTGARGVRMDIVIWYAQP